jgi:hypothetical protein
VTVVNLFVLDELFLEAIVLDHDIYQLVHLEAQKEVAGVGRLNVTGINLPQLLPKTAQTLTTRLPL